MTGIAYYSRSAPLLRRTLRLCGSCLVLLLPASCAVSPLAESWVEPRALERETPTWRPPVRTETTQRDDPLPRPEAPRDTLTLRESVALALLHNPALSAYGWEVRAAEARAIQAGLSPNPRMGYRAENLGGPHGNDLFMRQTVRLSQVIELSGKRRKRVRLAQADQRLRAWDFEARRIEVVTLAARRHVETVTARQRVELAERTLKLVTHVHEIVDQNAEAGVVPTSERDKAIVRMSIERIALENARHRLAAARQALASTWGGDRPNFQRAVGDLVELSVVPDLEHLLPLARNHPRLARWSDEIEQRRRAVTLSRSKAVPDVTAGAGVRHFPDANEVAAVLELSVPWPLFDRNQGRTLEARYALSRAMAMQREANAALHEELAAAHADVASAAFALDTLREQTLPAARAAFDAARDGFEKGTTDYLNVLDAERTLVDVERHLIDARERYHKSAATLEGLITTPLEDAAR